MVAGLDEKRSIHLARRLTGHYQLPVIAGFQLTYHAAIRMVARRIEIEDVAEALQGVSRPDTPETRKYLGTHAMVVVNPYAKTIVTVGYGYINQQRSA